MLNMEQIVFNIIPIRRRRVLLKPMNCPHHCELQCTTMVYKDLPKRYAEFGTYRYEQSGELHGLTRVRIYSG
jgi:threonyl-tRNA synthetase